MRKIVLSAQRTLEGFTYLPGVEYEVDEKTAAILAANFPRVYGEPKEQRGGLVSGGEPYLMGGEDGAPETFFQQFKGTVLQEEQLSTPKLAVVVEEVVEAGPPPASPPPQLDATDAAVRLAEESGVDLKDVVGTGSGGRIIKSDVEAFLSAS